MIYIVCVQFNTGLFVSLVLRPWVEQGVLELSLAFKEKIWPLKCGLQQ